MGYSEYVCYADYLKDQDEKEKKQLLYDDKLLFDNPGLYDEFFREGKPTLNFVITRSAHLSYKYNEVLSYWGLKQYPEYKGMTGSEEMDCAYLKARLVDDFFGRLLQALEAEGQLDNTIIIGVTDHYTYGYKNLEELAELSGTDRKLLLEKTPCFIWSRDLEPVRVQKTANASDLLPTLLNLFGVESDYGYIGGDVFDSGYPGFVPFSDGSWIDGRYAFDAGTEELMLLDGTVDPPTEEYVAEMNERVREYIEVNNLILDTDYYK
jgi:phosphoglycerol transferase MdoB-like AlkP superfamily enzyme